MWQPIDTFKCCRHKNVPFLAADKKSFTTIDSVHVDLKACNSVLYLGRKCRKEHKNLWSGQFDKWGLCSYWGIILILIYLRKSVQDYRQITMNAAFMLLIRTRIS